MIYDLIVCWNNGLKDTFSFTSEEAALNAEKDIKKAFGDRVKSYRYKQAIYCILTLDIIS